MKIDAHAPRQPQTAIARANMYTLRQAEQADYDFLYHLHKETMQAYVEATWGWNEEWQREYFDRKWDPCRRQIIQVNGRDAGVLVVDNRQGEHYLGLIELLPEFQGAGNRHGRSHRFSPRSPGTGPARHPARTQNKRPCPPTLRTLRFCHCRRRRNPLQNGPKNHDCGLTHRKPPEYVNP